MRTTNGGTELLNLEGVSRCVKVKIKVDIKSRLVVKRREGRRWKMESWDVK